MTITRNKSLISKGSRACGCSFLRRSRLASRRVRSAGPKFIAFPVAYGAFSRSLKGSPRPSDTTIAPRTSSCSHRTRAVRARADPPRPSRGRGDLHSDRHRDRTRERGPVIARVASVFASTLVLGVAQAPAPAGATHVVVAPTRVWTVTSTSAQAATRLYQRGARTRRG